jgi:Fe-S-cluster containining protein
MSLPIVTDCAGCDACCRHMGYPVFLHDSSSQADEEAWTWMPAELKRSLLASIEDYQTPPDGQLDGPCLWLDTETGRCKHHEFRPQVCRDFQIGSRGCLDWRAVYLVSCRA